MTQRSHRISVGGVLAVQLLFCVAFVAAWLLLPSFERHRLEAQACRKSPQPDVVFRNRIPTVVAPLFDDESIVTDDELRSVLKKLVPRFGRERLKPNYVEHALRTWRASIEFDDPELISGPQMTEFLLDTGRYVASWGSDANPILNPSENGVSVRWAADASASVHHDHMLASLAEAGIDLCQLVFTTSGQTSMERVLSEALRDFRLDERETEWSTLAFALYLAPQETSEWHNAQGRRISFDMLAERLMRSHRNRGVCLGTHRVYTLVALLRLNEDHGKRLIGKQTVSIIREYLEETRDLIVASQTADGSWPPNWHEGSAAAKNADPDEKLHRRVIATGHHLEWLAIAPKSLHPTHEQVEKAADWLIQNVQQTPQNVIDSNYTFYSHVANALALWRKTTPAEFWRNHVNSD